ncbi:PHP domain-containing protein [Desulfocurvus vexinensis]|uniref:PHP domain-containing protein n=1 Tax=Desulfocurvus vexinensis TaxID=399548 RepID=UPI00048B0737|nr:PHP domain-containing protein [Desulfocurvus vexinensis]
MPGIDLHTHSTASDGTLTPAELVALARRSGLEALALTDHDTSAGLPEALAAGRREGVEVIAGCELSVTSPSGFMHLLGLFLPERPARLEEGFVWLNERRASRNTRIVDKLRALGMDVTYERVLEIAGEGTVGRPHLALAIMEAGAASSVQEAFDRYLGSTGRAYLPKDKFTPAKALEILRAEGATTILAHPYTLELDGPALRALLVELKDLGLDGIEAHYTEHTRSQTEAYLALAAELDLVVSGGSDFHGAVKPAIALGRGRGGLSVPYKVLEDIKTHRRTRGLPA